MEFAVVFHALLKVLHHMTQIDGSLTAKFPCLAWSQVEQSASISSPREIVSDWLCRHTAAPGLLLLVLPS